MTKKKNIEYARKKFLERGFILDSNEYIDNKTHMECHDNDGYKYWLTLDVLRDKRTKKFNPVTKHNKFSIDNIQKFIYDKGYRTKILTKEYYNETSLLDCQCECGNIFTTYWNHIRGANKFTCDKCGKQKGIEKRTYTVEQVKEFCNKYGYKLLEDTYTNASNFSIQDKDGYKYKTRYYNIENGKNKFDKFSYLNPYTIENMLLYIKLNNLPIRLVDETERQINVRKEYIDIYCVECGKSFKATWSQITLNKRYRCKRCVNKESNNEYYVRKYLEEKNIDFIQEKKFNNCKYKKPLPFDFYIPSKNIVIEVHGQQHYYKNYMYTQSLEERQKIDKIKEQYCIDNDIKYIAIPYWLITQSPINTYKTLIDNILEKDQRPFLNKKTNQYRILAAVMSQMDVVQETYQQALDATGTTMKQNEVYMSSLEAKTTALKAEFENIVIGKGGLQDMAKFFVDLGTGALKLINSLGGLKTVLTVVAGVILTVKADVLTKGFINLTTAITNFIPNLTTMIGEFRLAKAETGSFADGLKAAGISASTAQIAIGALTAVISIGVMAWSSYQASVEKTKAALEQSRQEYEQYKSSLDGTIEKIKNESTNKEELIRINQDLNGSYDNEKQQLVDLNELRKENIDLLYEEAKAKAESYVAEHSEEASKAREYLEGQAEDLKGQIQALSNLNTRGGTSGAGIKTLQDLSKELTAISKLHPEEAVERLTDELNSLAKIETKNNGLTREQELRRRELTKALNTLKDKTEDYRIAVDAYDQALEDVDTLIFGGMDRGIDYSGFEKYLEKCKVRNLIGMPDTGVDICNALLERGCPKNLIIANTMEEAVDAAFRFTKKGKSCIMSPAASSYNVYKDFEHKGNHYKECVKNWKE